ncbi:hypothetical protein GPUN_2756 [Glaciecola punicea ACAM 611]|uniref:Uncharacterized protein n=1 Tax=Glaciecola punicea ACAM 611 TaxID=1121923 RepID=H5TEU3_9ALTE|nr:hypothetical protein GPUN_2756 [Glaciecola punicea ACAM 611]
MTNINDKHLIIDYTVSKFINNKNAAISQHGCHYKIDEVKSHT